MTKAQDIQRDFDQNPNLMAPEWIYSEMVQNIRHEIEGKYESMKKFEAETGISSTNLSRLFNACAGGRTPKRAMSVTLFFRICEYLDFQHPCFFPDTETFPKGMNVTVLDLIHLQMHLGLFQTLVLQLSR